MCGIVGYIGNRDASAVLLNGLRQLEYRGYDSAGLAILGKKGIRVRKKAGKLQNLELALEQDPQAGTVGLGHIRWATHGKPNEANAHPHLDCFGKIAVVHNGIIENFKFLKDKLEKEGHRFLSETDTEVIAHLIESHMSGDLEEAVRQALFKIEGRYSIGVISREDPKRVIGARSGSPLVVGIGKNEFFLASDVPAILRYTNEEIVLDDDDLVVLSPRGFCVTGIHNRRAMLKTVHKITCDIPQAEKEGYPNFMLKEIHEQPAAIRNTLSAYVYSSGSVVRFPELPESVVSSAERVRIIACATSYHAGYIGKYYIERLTGLPVEVDIASEFRYQDPILNSKTLTLAISQSGETPDTLAAMEEASRKGSTVLSITNIVGSSVARHAAGVIYTHSGPEIGVAPTKTFTSQLTALFLLAVFIGQEKSAIPQSMTASAIKTISGLPDLVAVLLARQKEITLWSNRYWKKDGFLFLGRGITYPMALEGALKIKEISHVHAEGHPAGELKHGVLELVDRNRPVVIFAPQGPLYEKCISDLKEVKSMGGIILALGTEGDKEIKKLANEVFYLPPVDEVLLPVLMSIPLQLLAYSIAIHRGCDVDQPRNIAKYITVE